MIVEVLIPLLLALLLENSCKIINTPFDKIEEVSGAIWYNGAIHAHDDDNGVIYRIEDGRITHQYKFKNDVYDLEDIAVYEDLIYVADTGRNGGGSKTYSIYVLDNFKQVAEVKFVMPILYDIEAIFISDNQIYLITKGRYSNVFKIDSYPAVPEFMGRLYLDNGKALTGVTGADSAGDGTFLVRNYGGAYVYRLKDLRFIKKIPTVFEVQGEAIAKTPYGYFTISEHSTHYSEYYGCLN